MFDGTAFRLRRVPNPLILLRLGLFTQNHLCEFTFAELRCLCSNNGCVGTTTAGGSFGSGGAGGAKDSGP
jgi:hypothetical protein